MLPPAHLLLAASGGSGFEFLAGLVAVAIWAISILANAAKKKQQDTPRQWQPSPGPRPPARPAEPRPQRRKAREPAVFSAAPLQPPELPAAVAKPTLAPPVEPAQSPFVAEAPSRVRRLLSNNARQAILLSEILSPPVSLRGFDDPRG
jgi:hypothetical protein